MKYSHIQKFLSLSLLITFTSSMSIAAPYYTYGSYNGTKPSNSVNTVDTSKTMILSGNVRLTDNNEKITLSLRDSDVKQVLRMFADKVGKNIIFHESVEGKITLDLVDMPINDAFNLVLQIAGLNYYPQGNTMIILAKTSEDNANFSKQEMMTFPVKYVNATTIASFLNKNVFGMKKTGLSGVDAATVNAATNEIIVFGMPSDAAIVKKVIEQFDREPLTKTFSVNHTTPAEMADMICKFLLPSRGDNSGNSSGRASLPSSIGQRISSIKGAITGGAAKASGSEALKIGEGVMACTVSQEGGSDTSTPFGAQNLAVSYFPQRGTISVIGGSEAQLQMIEKYIRDNDVKQPQAYLEMSIVELNEAGSRDFQNIWEISSKHWNATFDGQGISGGRSSTKYRSQTRYEWDGGPDRSGKAYPVYDSNGHITGYKLPTQIAQTYYSPVRSTHISYTMNYLIENQKARVLANPKILITNGQESVIDLTQDYVEKVTSEFLSSTGTGSGAIGTVQRTYTIGDDKGIKIALTPFISPDGYVTLNIKPEYATEAGKVYATGETGVNELQATLLSRRNLDLKNVRIKDGETLVIGGMVQEEESKTTHKIPLLGDLPLIGAAFRSSSTGKTKSELVIMITPRIIEDGAVADNL